MQHIFSKVAKRYRLTNHVLSLGLDLFWRRKLVKTVSNTTELEILDLACGGGELTKELLKLTPQRLIGADISQEMLNNAEKNDAEFVHLSDDKLPFTDNSFDLITIAFGVRNFQNRQTSLRECFRVLKKGGEIAILEFSLPKSRFLSSIYKFHLKWFVPIIGRICGGSSDPYKYLSYSIINFSLENLESELSYVGFKVKKRIKLFPFICSIVTAEK